MQDKITISALNGYYGGLLTEHQKEVAELYFDCDMSLAEISEELGITRQAVKQVVHSCVSKLSDFEKKLGLVAKVRDIVNSLERVIEQEKDEESKARLKAILEKIKEI